VARKRFAERSARLLGLVRVPWPAPESRDVEFRVWARLHPETSLLPVDMIEPVEFIVGRALASA
jgi:hypothetical protein